MEVMRQCATLLNLIKLWMRKSVSEMIRYLIMTGEPLSVPDGRDSNLQFTTVNNPLFINLSIVREGELISNAQTSEPLSSERALSVVTDAAQSARNETVTTAAMSRVKKTLTFPEVSVREIAEAYIVDDELVIATPAKPWWKQRSTILLLVAVVEW